MTGTDEIDRFFAMIEDQDVDFVGNNDFPDVPVLTYRWCRNETVADCAVSTLVDAGEQSMKDAGLKRVVRERHHLRGDSDTGQRVKMTVVRSKLRTMYVLMTAGMPGTREKAKEINLQLAQRIERLVGEMQQKPQSPPR
jgi:hypothetical protein